MNKFKQMKVDVNEIQQGDLVLCYDSSQSYFVKRISRTFLHNHKILHVVYDEGIDKNFLIEDIREFGNTRTIIRLVETSKKEKK